MDRDGTRQGYELELTRLVVDAVPIPVIASGGVGALDDLRALAAARIPMVVVGRALLERRFTLEEAIEVARC